MGRPPFSERGLVRSRRVLAAFTEDQYVVLQLAAEREETTIAELVAERALSVH